MDHAIRLKQLLPVVESYLATQWNATLLEPVEAIPGQASNRRYYRLRVTGPAPAETMILVQLPPDPYASDEAAEQSGQRELPFCSMLRFLESQGLPVPRLFADVTEDGFLLQEDLGRATLFDRLRETDPGEMGSHYARAIELLVAFQRATLEPPRQGPDCIGFQRRFGTGLLRWELDHFKEWLLLDWAGASLSPAEDDELEKAFDGLARSLAEAPYRLAHRDYQSTNLMIDGERLVLIDFQDALMAPLMYDLVALLRDSYIQLPPAVLEELLSEYYRAAADMLPCADEAEMRGHFHLQTVQRKLKDAGRFVFIDRVKGNPGFLQWVEPTLGYVRDALPHVRGGDRLQALLGRHVPALAEHKMR